MTERPDPASDLEEGTEFLKEATDDERAAVKGPQAAGIEESTSAEDLDDEDDETDSEAE